MKTLILESLTLIIALPGLAGNAVVLWLLGVRIGRTTFSVYMFNLAGADFLFLCCQILFSLCKLHVFPSDCFNIRVFCIPVLFLFYITGLSILSAISTERCLSVLWPIWYRCRRPRHTSAIMCALLWALSLLLSILEGNYCGFLTQDLHLVWCPVLDFITAAWLILLFVLTSGSSLALMTRLLCGSQRVPLTRLCVTLMLTVLVFLLCGLPLGIYWFLLFWSEIHLNAFSHISQVANTLSCINSSANPVIYFFVGSFRQRWQKRRQILRLLLQRALQDTPEGESLPPETLEMS
ncbi:PREDICTED: mas-related G-protein coupled receptor member X2-like [Miniopterus natalensis]|uniref:mas-related G-protein coupled receptor member X2-like n=1 Tax=Miniopterus natalensis TaxID=291302 RepID=UPI0007A6B6E3|nr:PREDICTED: mas-related G-protein coupled receptor member X2-like [Miniopterus natalensis]